MFEAIQIIQAQEALMQLRIIDYPTMTKEGRSRLFKDLKREAYPSILKPEAKPLTTADIARILSKG
jgi:hypothetical protein